MLKVLFFGSTIILQGRFRWLWNMDRKLVRLLRLQCLSPDDPERITWFIFPSSRRCAFCFQNGPRRLRPELFQPFHLMDLFLSSQQPKVWPADSMKFLMR